MKAKAIEVLYDQLETVEVQQEIYRIAAARDQSGKDICKIRNVKSATGEDLMKDDEKVTSRSANITVVSNSYHTLLKYGRELWIGG